MLHVGGPTSESASEGIAQAAVKVSLFACSHLSLSIIHINDAVHEGELESRDCQSPYRSYQLKTSTQLAMHHLLRTGNRTGVDHRHVELIHEIPLDLCGTRALYSVLQRHC